MLENIKTVSDLKLALTTINVKDYGDFKRKAVLYINRLMELPTTTGAQKKTLVQMVDRIQFHTNFDIEGTRNWSLQELKKI